jgi:hypothetical protein
VLIGSGEAWADLPAVAIAGTPYPDQKSQHVSLLASIA